jgi:hypothetical protein
MPRGGSKSGERRGGRQKGTLNKRTVARVAQAERHFAEAKAEGRKLAIDELAWLASVLREGVEHFRPHFDRTDVESENRYLRWATALRQVLSALALYQSATYRAVLMTQPPAAHDDPSAAERLIAFFDRMAETQAYERREARVAKLIDGK